MLIKTNNIDLIHKLDIECFDNFYTLNIYSQMINTLFFIIHEEQTNVGFIIVLLSGNDYELIKIGIKKEYRQKSYALKAMVELIQILDFHKMFLEVNENNVPAIKLYEKVGFNKIYVRRNYYGNSNAIVMEFIKKKL